VKESVYEQIAGRALNHQLFRKVYKAYETASTTGYRKLLSIVQYYLAGKYYHPQIIYFFGLHKILISEGRINFSFKEAYINYEKKSQFEPNP
jgi:hypothetical protein